MPYVTWEQRQKLIEEKQRKRTTLNKARKGFPVKLNRGWAIVIQAAYAWLKLRNRTTPGMDVAVQTIPETSPDDYGVKTVRVRGDQVDGMIELLKFAANFPGITWSIHERIADLEKISTMDKMADAGR